MGSQPICPLNQQPQMAMALATDNTNVGKDANTSNKFEKSNTPPLYPWYGPVLSEGAGPAATFSLRRLAALLIAANQSSYSKVMELLRVRLSFALMRSTIAYLCSSRSSTCHSRRIDPATADLAEGQVSSSLT